MLSTVVAGVVVVVDQLSKNWAEARGLVSVNTGISFGFFDQQPEFLSLAISAGLICLGWFVLRHQYQKSPLVTGLFVGGALGNIVDRILVGGVRDWLPMVFLPIKNNLADWAIGLAVIGVLVSQLRNKSAE